LLFSGILIFLMAWLQTYGVTKRYIFHAPDPTAYELSTMFLLFCGVLAVAGVDRLNRHVMNDLISSRFPATLKLVSTGIIVPILALVFCYVLIWKSMDNAIYALQIGQTSQSPWALPLAPIKFVIPAGYILLALVLVLRLVQMIAALAGHQKPAPYKIP
jgi:TRAP-type mannitol/chloroaromatic compound transport system permease small subunit